LANLANGAALLAARRNHHTVQTADFTDSLEKILLGAPRGIVLSASDRERTAYHEAGHALLGMLIPGADPVRKVSIIPRGAALGVTLSAPDDDQVSYTRDDLLGKIKVALGGRVAEELVFDTITTGAESDIEHVTAIARQMVGRWGMSEAIGFVTVLPTEARGPFLTGSGETSEATQRIVDETVRGLIDAAHQDVTAVLTAHLEQLQTLARALLKHETLDEPDAYAAAGMPSRPTDSPQPTAAGTATGRGDLEPPSVNGRPRATD
jgi:cell division protease FtsH